MVTKIILRLLPLPKVQVDLLVPFDDIQAAADTVSDIIAHRIVPTAIEFMEQDSMLAVERLLEKPGTFQGCGGPVADPTGRQYPGGGGSRDGGGGRYLPGERGPGCAGGPGRPTRERLWEARRMIIDALNQESPVNHMEDVVVPRAESSAC